MKALTRPILSGLPLLLTLVAAAAFAVLSSLANGEETIHRFDSLVEVNRDGTLTVRETIEFEAEHKEIRHGIYRDFPLRLPESKTAAFKVLSLAIDGADSRSYQVERIGRIVRVTMGNKVRELEWGRHTFTLTYRTSGQIRLYEEHCELDWDATGAGWAFTINEASCRIVVPEDGTVGVPQAWINSFGAYSTEFVDASRPEPNAALFTTQNKLFPKQGLSVSVQFPRHLVSDPAKRHTKWAALVTALTFVYFLVTWRIWGKDPSPGTIIPLFYPPEAGYYGTKKGAERPGPAVLSSVAASYVKNKGILAENAFTSVFISLAAHGTVRLRKNDGNQYVVAPLATSPEALGRLAPEEKAAYDELAQNPGIGKELVIENENIGVIYAIRSRVVQILSDRYGSLWIRNTLLQVFGWLVVLPAGIIAINTVKTDFPQAFIMPAILVCIAFVLRKQIAYHWSRSINAVNPIKIVAMVVAAILFLALHLRGLSVLVAVVGLLFQHVLSVSVFTVLLVAIPMLFCPEMDAPSKTCRRLLDKIDGLLLYISVAERDRLRALNPPEDTPEAFAKLLPYAAAFGLEGTWCSRFASVIAAAEAPGVKEATFGDFVDLIDLVPNGDLSSFHGSFANAFSPPVSGVDCGGGGGSIPSLLGDIGDIFDGGGGGGW